jgi:glycosyltransferase involved in cell wall biosynthesis
MRLVILVRRLGPYHNIRLEAAGRLGDLWCVEGGGADATYAWDSVPGARSFRRLTLFPYADPGQLSSRTVQAAVFRALNQLQPTVVAIPGWEDRLALAALHWATAHSIPVIVMSDSNEFDAPRTRLKEWIKRCLVGLCSAGLVAGTTAADYLAKLGMSRERIFTGYDVVDNEYFWTNAEKLKAENGKQKAESRKRYSLPERYFLASARFVEKKNLPRLLEAYAKYRERAERRKQKAEIWDLVLLGDGPLRSALCSQLHALGLDDSVHMPGFKQYEELPVYYGLASAFVHASAVEQWGLVVNEAMASGLPVLVSNRCGCAPDLVQEGVNGFNFDPYDTEALAQLMLSVSAFSFPLSAFGSVSRRIIADWGPERFADNLWQAAGAAVAQPRHRVGWLDKLLIWSAMKA